MTKSKLPYTEIPNKIHIGTSNYTPKYCEAVVNWMAAGNSFQSFAVSKGMTSSNMGKWVDIYPDFANAREIAEEAYMVYWEKVARDQATGDAAKGSSASMQFIMRNRFRDQYGDKQQIETNTNVVFRIESGFAPPQALPQGGDIIDATVVDNEEDLV